MITAIVWTLWAGIGYFSDSVAPKKYDVPWRIIIAMVGRLLAFTAAAILATIVVNR